MKTQARHGALFLALTTLATLTLSCGSGTETPTETTTAVPSADTTTTLTAADIIGFPTEDNGDTTIRILMGDHSQYEFMIEEQSGDIVDDAVYNRNRDTEDYLGIKLEFESRPGWSGDQSMEFNSLIRNAVAAGDDTYQLINGLNCYTVRLIPDNVFINLYDIKSINLDNPWWAKGFPIADGKLYYAFNDASLSLYKDLYCMFFNKNLIDELKLEDPYELVFSGKWTLDKFISIAKDGAADLNGDGEITVETDRLSYLCKDAANRGLLASTECSIIDTDKGEYRLAALSERLFDVYETMRGFMVGNTAFYNDYAADYGAVAKPFIEGRALFMSHCLSATEHMRDMKDDYGIIPQPKYDENQENYHSQIATSTSAFYIPKTAGNPELVGKVCEVLGYYSRENVVPAYYEIALKAKFSRDETSREVVEILRENATTNFDFAYASVFPTGKWPHDFMMNAIADRDLPSLYDSYKSAWESTLNDLTTADLD